MRRIGKRNGTETYRFTEEGLYTSTEANVARCHMAGQDIQHCGAVITSYVANFVVCHVGHTSDSWTKVGLCPKTENSRWAARSMTCRDGGWKVGERRRLLLKRERAEACCVQVPQNAGFVHTPDRQR
jgi:hypothetical protein